MTAPASVAAPRPRRNLKKAHPPRSRLWTTLCSGRWCLCWATCSACVPPQIATPWAKEGLAVAPSMGKGGKGKAAPANLTEDELLEQAIAANKAAADAAEAGGRPLTQQELLKSWDQVRAQHRWRRRAMARTKSCPALRRDPMVFRRARCQGSADGDASGNAADADWPRPRLPRRSGVPIDERRLGEGRFRRHAADATGSLRRGCWRCAARRASRSSTSR